MINTRVLLIEARRHLETAVRLRPHHPRYLELLGTACFVSGDTLAATQHFEQAFARDRSTRLAWLLAWTHVHTGRLADVERLVRELVEEGRGCPRALYIRSLARFRRKAYDLAIEDLREAMPDEVDVPFFRIELARLSIAAALGTPAATASGSNAVVAAAARARYLRDATDLLRAGHIDDPDSVHERNYLSGCAYLELGEPTRALSVLTETEYPDHAEVSFRRGLAAARDGDSETAANCFEEASESPELENAAQVCRTALASSGSLEAVSVPRPQIAPLGIGPAGNPAIARLVIRGDRSPSPVTAPLAPPPSLSGDPVPPPSPDAALARLQASGPRNGISSIEAAADCVRVLEDSRDLEPGLRKAILRGLADVLHVDLKTSAEDVAANVPLLERLKTAMPGLAFPHLDLARARYRAADFPGAIEELTGLAGPLANHVVVHNVLGRSLEKLGHLQEAQHAFEDSLAKRVDQPTIQFSLGRILLLRWRQTCVGGT